VRVNVPRLYRSQDEQSRIESTLSKRDGITAVYANPLTANVLILFDPAISTETLIKDLGLVHRVEPVAQQARSAQVKTSYAGKKKSDRPMQEQQREMYPSWHLRRAEEAIAEHQSSMEHGLSSATVEKRLRYGYNRLPAPQVRSSLDILLSQFQSLPVLLLGISAGLSLVTGGLAEALTIGAVLLMNGGIGFVTERRAESTIASLSELVDDVVPVLRNGKAMMVQATHIVPGDILMLAPGVRVAADARLIKANALMLDESALTGESHFVLKQSDALTRQVALADRSNMAYMGTAVAAGSGLAVVVGTGLHTEIGAIQSLMNVTEPPKTPIQKQLDHLGNRLVKISVGVCAGVFIIGILRGNSLLKMLKASISLAIAAVPEGLPTVATTSLARGLRIMRDKQMLIRRLQAVETLGAIHTICLDKTGTLTLNRMCAMAMQAGNRHYELKNGAMRWRNHVLQDKDTVQIARLLQVCVLCNELVVQNGHAPSSLQNGSATENALVELAASAGIQVEQLRNRYPILHATLRAEGRNYMKTVHAMPPAQGRQFVAVKGSPLEVLALCGQLQDGDRVIDLTEHARTEIAHQNEWMAKKQLRVLGFAYAEMPVSSLDIGSDEAASARLIWLGLVGLADPLRTGADKVIDDLHHAGIHTKMITGDQRTTAYAIGKSLKMAEGRKPHVLDTEMLDRIDHQASQTLVSEADIFARVSPARKLQIVNLLQESGEVVAMTGDGINDGPALRASNVGIAMGLHGTDLARSAADVVLMNDKLESILEAIREGRTITTNIEKSLHFLISSNFSEILVVLSAISTVGAAPLSPMQLLWINLLTDVLPAIAFASEPAESDLMQRPPREIGKPLIGGRELKRYGVEGGYLAGGAMGSYLYGLLRYGNGTQASTLTFNTLVLGQLLHALSCRSEHRGVFSHATAGKNNQMNLAIGGSIALQVVANFIPGLRRFLGLSTMTLTDMAVTCAGAAIPMLLTDASKKDRDASQ
jgi:Ca2+-transporting ATPase